MNCEELNSIGIISKIKEYIYTAGSEYFFEIIEGSLFSFTLLMSVNFFYHRMMDFGFLQCF